MIYLGKTSVGIAAIVGTEGVSMRNLEIVIPDLSDLNNIVITKGQRVSANGIYALYAI